jgi:hypothetical protein
VFFLLIQPLHDMGLIVSKGGYKSHDQIQEKNEWLRKLKMIGITILVECALSKSSINLLLHFRTLTYLVSNDSHNLVMVLCDISLAHISPHVPNTKLDTSTQFSCIGLTTIQPFMKYMASTLILWICLRD